MSRDGIGKGQELCGIFHRVRRVSYELDQTTEAAAVERVPRSLLRNAPERTPTFTFTLSSPVSCCLTEGRRRRETDPGSLVLEAKHQQGGKRVVTAMI